MNVMAVKLTVNLSDEVASTLKSMADANGVTVTEQLRRAISTEKWLKDVHDEKKKVLLENNGKIQEVVFRP
jgi:predicted GIY-YIG superfamily endonuclease